jgi:hypothetical protein
MTVAEALFEAKRRWGRNGSVQTLKTRKLVGAAVLGIAFQVYGGGDTWEAAFEAADERKKRLGRD